MEMKENEDKRIEKSTEWKELNEIIVLHLCITTK